MTDLHIIGDSGRKRKSMYDPNLAERINKETEAEIRKNQLEAKLKKKKLSKEQPEQISHSSSIKQSVAIESFPDFWSISGVQYKDGIYTVDLLKTLLNSGNAKTQDEWIKFRKKAMPKNEFYTGDMPLQHALFTAIYKLRDDAVRKDEVETIKEFVKKSMFERWLSTTTRIMYQPSGVLEDVIIHNKGMSDEYSVKENFVFSYEYVKNSKRPSNYKALLGTNNLEEIQNVYQWLTEKDAYLLGVNSRTNDVQERVAGFNADSDGAGLYCNGFPSGSDAGLGVRLRRALASFAQKTQENNN